MSRKELQNIIVNYLREYNPDYVGIFGSYADTTLKKYNDIDILVKFRNQFSLLQLIRIENDLSQKLGIKVDLITEGALKNRRIRESIQNDLKIIYKA
jgi:predicted nucleotidyltransferase